MIQSKIRHLLGYSPKDQLIDEGSLDKTPIKKIIGDIEKIQDAIHYKVFAPIANGGMKDMAATASNIIKKFTDLKASLRALDK